LVALVAAALVVGMGVGFAEGVHLKSTRNFTVGVSGGAQSGGENPNVLRDPATAPVSSIHIRLELMRSALSQSPNHLLEGNGVGMLRDETTEAKLIGAAGCCTFPHNETIEALYSFGVPGLVLYLVLLVAAFGAALTRAYHSRGDVPSMFVLGFLIFAFVNSNLSGAIGSDAWLWAAGAMSVALPRRVSD
jgi:hypothetical protein